MTHVHSFFSYDKEKNNLLITTRRNGSAILRTKTVMKHLNVELSDTKCCEASKVQSHTKVILNFQLITN